MITTKWPKQKVYFKFRSESTPLPGFLSRHDKQFYWKFKSRSAQTRINCFWKNGRFRENKFRLKTPSNVIQYSFTASSILYWRMMFIKSYLGWSHLIRNPLNVYWNGKHWITLCDLHTVNFTLLKYIDITFRDWVTIRMSTIVCKMDKILKIYLVTIFQIWIYWFILRAVCIVNQKSYLLPFYSQIIWILWYYVHPERNKFNNSKHWFNFLPSNSHHVNKPELQFPRYELFVR